MRPTQITDAACARRGATAPVPDSVVVAILEAFASGAVSMRSLAQQHGRAEKTVSGIVRGETHTHVPGPRLSADEIAALGVKHRGTAISRSGSGRGVFICKGCGKAGHRITECPDPRGR